MIAKEKSYDYEYYMSLPEGTRVELIDGQIYDMAAAPSSQHQLLVTALSRLIGNYLEGKKCMSFVAPFDVFLTKINKDIKKSRYIVQPDISVICDKSKIVEQGCKGAPDFIIEVVSLSTKTHDYIRKLNIYNDFKVKEYWIVNPLNETVTVYVSDSDEGFSEPTKYTFKDKIKSSIFKELTINFAEIQLL